MLKVTDYGKRIEGTEDEISALIIAAKMDGCWDAVDTYARVMMRSIAADWAITVVRNNEWNRLVDIARKMGAEDDGI